MRFYAFFLSGTFPPSEEGLSHLWNCFCSGYSWSRDGIRRMGKLVHKSRPQQLCLIPTSVLLGQLSKAELECGAHKSVPIKFRNCAENINRQKLRYLFIPFRFCVNVHDRIQMTRKKCSRKSNTKMNL